VEADIGQAVVAEHTQGVQRLGTISDDLPDVHGPMLTVLPLPSAASQRYNMRERSHSLQLPEHSAYFSDSNFIIHMLYKNAYSGWRTPSLDRNILLTLMIYII